MTKLKKIRLLLIEDNKILRDAISKMLKPYEDIEVIAATGISRNTITNIHNLKPNVILLDLGLRSQSSLRVVKVVKDEFPEAKVIVMDLVPVQSDVLQFIKAGASGFILKDATRAEFLNTIRTVAIGEKILPNIMTESLFTQIIEYALINGSSKFKSSVRLTKREKQVMSLIGDAMSNKEISQKLKISTFTVKSHVRNILEKLALHSRLEVANLSLTGRSKKNITESIPILNNQI